MVFFGMLLSDVRLEYEFGWVLLDGFQI